MKKIYILVTFIVLSSSLLAETLTGVITDAFTREPLIGVSILNKDNGTGTVTDLDGRYELQITTTPVHLQFSIFRPLCSKLLLTGIKTLMKCKGND